MLKDYLLTKCSPLCHIHTMIVHLVKQGTISYHYHIMSVNCFQYLQNLEAAYCIPQDYWSRVSLHPWHDCSIKIEPNGCQMIYMVLVQQTSAQNWTGQLPTRSFARWRGKKFLVFGTKDKHLRRWTLSARQRASVPVTEVRAASRAVGMQGRKTGQLSVVNSRVRTRNYILLRISLTGHQELPKGI